MLNRIHIAVASASLVLIHFIALGAHGLISRSIVALALWVLLALAGNALICAVFSIPTNRYQGRRLAPFTVFIAVAG